MILLARSCYGEQDKQDRLIYSKDKNLIKTLPRSPVKIKFKKDGKGDYSWEITGEDAREIIRNNKILEDRLNNK